MTKRVKLHLPETQSSEIGLIQRPSKDGFPGPTQWFRRAFTWDLRPNLKTGTKRIIEMKFPRISRRESPASVDVFIFIAEISRRIIPMKSCVKHRDAAIEGIEECEPPSQCMDRGSDVPTRPKRSRRLGCFYRLNGLAPSPNSTEGGCILIENEWTSRFTR